MTISDQNQMFHLRMRKKSTASKCDNMVFCLAPFSSAPSHFTSPDLIPVKTVLSHSHACVVGRKLHITNSCSLLYIRVEIVDSYLC